jgi:uncharacterized membrane protein
MQVFMAVISMLTAFILLGAAIVFSVAVYALCNMVITETDADD